MSSLKKLIEKARTSPSNLRFEEVCKLAEMVGFEFARQNGTSHKIYKHPLYPRHLMNFQSVKGGAKKFQVQQLLDFIDEKKLA